MSSRFPHNANRPSSSLFSAYDSQAAAAARNKSQSPSLRPYPPSPQPASHQQFYSKKSDDIPRSTSNPSFGAYPGSTPSSSANDNASHFRAATPNKRGQYSDAVLSELESQNDEQMAGTMAKVRMLKDLTTAIGDEIRDSSALAEKMNATFENTRVRLRGTMNRMLRMAESTGVGWRVWLGFFVAIILLFWYVWLF